jgi:transcriptional repressor NF-X1
LNVVRKEDESAGSGGWSQVAKGGSGVKRVMDTTVGGRSSFTVLGSRKEKKEKEKEVEKRKIVQEDAVEDWEKEVEGWGDA